MKNVLIIICIWVISASLLMASPLKLKKEVLISGNKLYFKDLVLNPQFLDDKDKNIVVKEFRSIRGGIITQFHLKRFLTKNSLNYQLEKIEGVIKVKVKLVDQLERVKEEIKNYLKNNFLAKNSSFKVELKYYSLELPENIKVKIDRVRHNRGSFSILWEGKVIKRGFFSFSLQKVVKVPVALREIKAGEVIQKDDFKWCEKVVEEDNDYKSVNPLGMVAARNILPETIIQNYDIRKKILVKKGQLISLIKKSGEITLLLKGIAMEAGGKGEIIKVRSKNNPQKIFECLIKDKDTIIIL